MSFLHKSQSQQKPQSSISIETTSLKSSFSSKHQDECESDDDSVPASPASVASDSSAGSWGKMSQLSRGPPAIRRHPEYYIDSGDVVFLVEYTLFKVHSYFFVRESTKFRDMLCIPSRTGPMLKASSDSYPVELHDASAKDFARFLWVFYNPTYSYAASISKWSSILRLSHLWSFPHIKSLAVREMDLLPISPVDKAVMAREYQVDPERRWLETAYAALGAREEPLTKEEGRRLGLDVVLLLARVRERIRERKRREGEEREARETREKEKLAMRSPPPTNAIYERERAEKEKEEEEEYFIQRAAAIATAQDLVKSHNRNGNTSNAAVDSGTRDDFRPVSPVRSDRSYDDDDDDDDDDENENECGYDPRMAESMYLPPKPPSTQSSNPTKTQSALSNSNSNSKHQNGGAGGGNSSTSTSMTASGGGSHTGSSTSTHPSFSSSTSLTTPPTHSISQNHPHIHRTSNYPLSPTALHQIHQMQLQHQQQQQQMEKGMPMKGYTEEDVSTVKEVFVS